MPPKRPRSTLRNECVVVLMRVIGCDRPLARIIMEMSDSRLGFGHLWTAPAPACGTPVRVGNLQNGPETSCVWLDLRNPNREYLLLRYGPSLADYVAETGRAGARWSVTVTGWKLIASGVLIGFRPASAEPSPEQRALHNVLPIAVNTREATCEVDGCDVMQKHKRLRLWCREYQPKSVTMCFQWLKGDDQLDFWLKDIAYRSGETQLAAQEACWLENAFRWGEASRLEIVRMRDRGFRWRFAFKTLRRPNLGQYVPYIQVPEARPYSGRPEPGGGCVVIQELSSSDKLTAGLNEVSKSTSRIRRRTTSDTGMSLRRQR